MRLVSFTVSVKPDDMVKALPIVNTAPVDYDIRRDTSHRRMEGSPPRFLLEVSTHLGADITEVYNKVHEALEGTE